MTRTLTCSRCRVDVPIDQIDTPNRCHKDCPLTAERTAEIADALAINHTTEADAARAFRALGHDDLSIPAMLDDCRE